jgi:chemotaxis protein CheZ
MTIEDVMQSIDESGLFDVESEAQAVLARIGSVDQAAALQALIEFSDHRNAGLYRHVGKITRGLHSAIVSLDIDPQVPGAEGRDIQSRLGYVMELTSEAANKTMDVAEEALPVARALGEESGKLLEEWKRLRKRELSGDDFRLLYARIGDFLGYSVQESAILNQRLNDIVLAQSYQDLSGQIIQKTMSMLRSTESELVRLLSVAGTVKDGLSSSSTMDLLLEKEVEVIDSIDVGDKNLLAEGPLPKGADVLNDQDDVNDLLSSLGF